MRLPAPVPELPVSSIQASRAFYQQTMGFRVEWMYADDLAGISKDAVRIFLRRRTEREASQGYNVLVWLNLASPVEVDQLYQEWKQSGVPITEALETKPWKLREFTARDPDGNRFRVFYDLGAAD
jgi:predicted lactoylglutathione lyase